MDRTERQEDSAAMDADAPTYTCHLRLIHGKPRGAVFEIDASGVTLGRDAEPRQADVAVSDARMSRQHARIECGGTGFQLRDLGSRNGGFLDGSSFQPGASVSLSDGAVIRLGDSIFVFRVGAPMRDGDADHELFPGVSPAAAGIRRRLRALSEATGHVLILGETGTGKESAARWIGRKVPTRSFIPHNCAELRRDLARSELFGHARGAFSGAVTAKEGLVDIAQDGVLFLDEIGELPLDVQGDLLRFLEDGRYRPVGSTDLRTSRARIVAATNIALEDAARTGRFRRDLLARLRASNLPLELPPLHERREDILGWARRFLEEALPEGAPAEPWTSGAAECLLVYAWPENLRELRGVVRGLAEEGRWPVPSSALPEKIRAHRRTLRVDQGGVDVPSVDEQPDDPGREEIERALVLTQGRMLPAAERLGVDRRKLYRLCEKLGIEVGAFRRGG